MEILSAVKFATLHNENTIFYSHISYVNQSFEKISKLNNDVILITGNCDPSVMSFSAPDNVKYWFSQNCLVQHEKAIPIPIGLRNPFPYYIDNQVSITSGASYENGQFCQETFKRIYLSENNSPTKFLYANFNVGTNLGYRTFIKQLCERTPYINYEDPIENENGYNNYCNQILDHESTICPIGNGIDTHRIWEVLYCKRIPITINVNCYNRPKINSNFVGEGPQILPQVDEYAIYTKLYSQLPVVILNSYEELLDRQHLENLIEYQKTKQCNFNLLDFNYWKGTILNLEKTLIT